MKKIALIGNPNCGKTTLFNLLTGARQKVGNWPGVTVEKKFGYCIMGNQQAELIDLPGIYSLEQEYQVYLLLIYLKPIQTIKLLFMIKIKKSF